MADSNFVPELEAPALKIPTLYLHPLQFEIGSKLRELPGRVFHWYTLDREKPATDGNVQSLRVLAEVPSASDRKKPPPDGDV